MHGTQAAGASRTANLIDESVELALHGLHVSNHAAVEFGQRVFGRSRSIRRGCSHLDRLPTAASPVYAMSERWASGRAVVRVLSQRAPA